MFEGVNLPKRPNPEQMTSVLPLELSIDNIDDARECVAELLAQGICPIITVPEEYAEELLTNGVFFLPKEDLLSGKRFSFVAGTIGLEPYLPEGKERLVLEVNPEGVRIEPRLTGKDKHLHGVVGFPDGVPASAFIEKGKFSKESWEDQVPGIDESRKPLH
jgi:hypothetical protein